MCFPNADVIDLTGDDKDDLQRAIALSLEESNRAFRETGITDEEQAISRWAQQHYSLIHSQKQHLSKRFEVLDECPHSTATSSPS